MRIRRLDLIQIPREQDVTISRVGADGEHVRASRRKLAYTRAMDRRPRFTGLDSAKVLPIIILTSISEPGGRTSVDDISWGGVV